MHNSCQINFHGWGAWSNENKANSASSWAWAWAELGNTPTPICYLNPICLLSQNFNLFDWFYRFIWKVNFNFFCSVLSWFKFFRYFFIMIWCCFMRSVLGIKMYGHHSSQQSTQQAELIRHISSSQLTWFLLAIIIAVCPLLEYSGIVSCLFPCSQGRCHLKWHWS